MFSNQRNMCSVFIDSAKTCKCVQCGKAFGSEKGLKIHIGKIHKTKQGVLSENSKQRKSLKQDSNQDQSQTIKPQQRSVGRSVDNDSGNSPEGSVNTDIGNSSKGSVEYDSGNSTGRSMDTDSGNSTERSVDNNSGNSTERSMDNNSGNSPEIDSTSALKHQDSSRHYVDKPEAADGVSYDLG